MSNQFHNRLVGTIVVVALGVIFLPDILDGKKPRQEEQFAEIPLRPKVEQQATPVKVLDVISKTADTQMSPQDEAEKESWVITNNEEIVDTELGKDKVLVVEAPTAKPASKTITPKDVTGDDSASKKVIAKATNTPAKKIVQDKKDQVAWTLQLGSFNHAGNVNALVKKLRKSGFRAYTLPSDPVDGKLTKVFVGPDISKEKIKKLQKDVEKVTKLKGRMVPYNPLETSS